VLGSFKAWRARAAQEASARAALKERVRILFGLGPDDQVSITEASCPDPGCPDRETLILIMPSGEPTRAVRLAGRPEAIEDVALEAAAALQGSPARR